MFSLRLLSSVRAIRSTSQTFRCLSSSPTLKCSQDVSVSSQSPSSPESEKPKSAKPETFAHMLRHSKFVQIGDPVGKVFKLHTVVISENHNYFVNQPKCSLKKR